MGPLPNRRVSAFSQDLAPTGEAGIPNNAVAMIEMGLVAPVPGYVEGSVRFECYGEYVTGARAVSETVVKVLGKGFGRVTRIYHQDGAGPRGVRWPRYMVEANVAGRLDA